MIVKKRAMSIGKILNSKKLDILTVHGDIVPSDEFYNNRSTNFDTKKKDEKIYIQEESSENDKEKTTRSLFTTLLHSLDANVATTVRYELNLIDINVYTIHDCFMVEANHMKILLLKYKEILFREVFDKSPLDILCIQKTDLPLMHEELERRKKIKE